MQLNAIHTLLVNLLHEEEKKYVLPPTRKDLIDGQCGKIRCESLFQIE